MAGSSLEKWLAISNEILWLSKFMDFSMFSGGLPGGADPAKLFMIAGLLLYLLSWSPLSTQQLRRLRPELGFLVLSGTVTAVCIVHGLKWTVGRARPYYVRHHDIPFTYWFEPGPYNLLEGYFRPAFPSGHTATVTIFFVLAYILAFAPGRPRPRLGAGVAAATLVFSLLMAACRSMNTSHFFTDGLAVIGINLLIIHLLYFYVLDIPGQTGGVRRKSFSCKPFFWELRLSLYSLALTASLAAVVTGFRGYTGVVGSYPVVLVAAGVPLTVFLLICLLRLYRRGQVLCNETIGDRNTFQVTQK